MLKVERDTGVRTAMVDKVDGSQASAAAQVAEQQRVDELEQAQRERLLADAAIEKAAEISQSAQVRDDPQSDITTAEANGDAAAGFSLMNRLIMPV